MMMRLENILDRNRLLGPRKLACSLSGATIRTGSRNTADTKRCFLFFRWPPHWGRKRGSYHEACINTSWRKHLE